MFINLNQKARLFRESRSAEPMRLAVTWPTNVETPRFLRGELSTVRATDFNYRLSIFATDGKGHRAKECTTCGKESMSIEFEQMNFSLNEIGREPFEFFAIAFSRVTLPEKLR